MKRLLLFPLIVGLCMVLPAAWAADAEEDGRPQLWVDVHRGEPIPYAAMLDDLAQARVIYLGERHGVARHHRLQAAILRDLAARDVALARAMEQLEADRQPAIAGFHRGEPADFEALAKAANWAQRWPGYEDYRDVVLEAQVARAPLVALNARRETIRDVFRQGGVERLDPQQRAELPEHIWLDEPPYAHLLRLLLGVHLAAAPERMQAMIEAQMARDEAMAAHLAAFLDRPEAAERTVLVLCGSGHAAYGLGMVSRLRRRVPEIRDRIVIFSESGDVELSPEMRAHARDVEITTDDLRAIGRPIADYLHVTGLRDGRHGEEMPASESPAEAPPR